MPIQFDNFDQQKVDRLKNHLVAMAAKDKAKNYEIFVDALKAVPKTDEPNDFDGYEDYMTPDTEQIKIIIYNSAASPRNDQYVFLLKARNREEATNLGLNGMPVKTFSRNSLSEWREAQEKKSAETMEIANLKKTISELRQEIGELEDENEQLSNAVLVAEENRNKIGGVHWGDVLSHAVEGIVRRNTHLIAQIPGASGLAGLIEKDNSSPLELPQENKEVSFKKKENTTVGKDISPEEKEFIKLFHELHKYFTQAEIGQIIGLLDEFSKDKTLLESVLEFIQEEEGEEDQSETKETNQ